jgi:Flp pilus assembly protein TadG
VLLARLRQHDAERGAAAVEFALVLPLYLLLLFGIVDFARAFNIQLTLSDAAAEGARTLAVGGTATAAHSAAGSALAATLVSPAEVTYPTTVTCPAAAAPGTATASMTVATQDFQFLTPLIGSLVGDLTISGTAARQCSN